MRATIVSEVRTALDQHETARSLLERIESAMLLQARQVREITEYSYQRGEASLLQFLDAEREYKDTMHSYANARAEYARSLYLIYSVTAKGVERVRPGGTDGHHPVCNCRIRAGRGASGIHAERTRRRAKS